MFDSLVFNELGLVLLGMSIGFVSGVWFAMYVLPLLARLMAGRTRGRG